MCVRMCVWQCEWAVLRGFEMNYIRKPPKAIHIPFPFSSFRAEKPKRNQAKSHENLSLKNVLRDDIYFHVSVTFSVTTLSAPIYFIVDTHTHTPRTSHTLLFLLKFHFLIKWWCTIGFWPTYCSNMKMKNVAKVKKQYQCVLGGGGGRDGMSK